MWNPEEGLSEAYIIRPLPYKIKMRKMEFRHKNGLKWDTPHIWFKSNSLELKYLQLCIQVLRSIGLWLLLYGWGLESPLPPPNTYILNPLSFVIQVDNESDNFYGVNTVSTQRYCPLMLKRGEKTKFGTHFSKSKKCFLIIFYEMKKGLKKTIITMRIFI